MDDALSLQGGTLIFTPLRGADNVVYALAQGPLSIGGFQFTVPQGSNTPLASIRRTIRPSAACPAAHHRREARGEIVCNGTVRLLLLGPRLHHRFHHRPRHQQATLRGSTVPLNAGTVQVFVPREHRVGASSAGPARSANWK